MPGTCQPHCHSMAKKKTLKPDVCNLKNKLINIQYVYMLFCPSSCGHSASVFKDRRQFRPRSQHWGETSRSFRQTPWPLHHRAWLRLPSTPRILSRQYEKRDFYSVGVLIGEEVTWLPGWLFFLHSFPSLSLIDSAVVNLYKAQKSPAVQHVGVSAFYTVVSFVSEDTLRHPPTRQYLSSCVEILGQVRTRSFYKHTCRGWKQCWGRNAHLRLSDLTERTL